MTKDQTKEVDLLDYKLRLRIVLKNKMGLRNQELEAAQNSIDDSRAERFRVIVTYEKKLEEEEGPRDALETA